MLSAMGSTRNNQLSTLRNRSILKSKVLCRYHGVKNKLIVVTDVSYFVSELKT